MDLADNGRLMTLAGGLGEIVSHDVLIQDLERLAVGIHVRPRHGPELVIAGSGLHDDVLAMFTDAEGARNCIVASRVLINERVGEMGLGRVVTLPPGSARGVRGSTGSFATFLARDVELPKWIRVFAVHAPPPICEWEKATLDEVKGYVPDLVSRFARRKKTGAPAKDTGPRTRVRKRPKV